MRAGNFLYNGQRCPFCNSNFNKIDLKAAKKKFENVELELLDNTYINEHKKMKYKCKKCNNIHYMSYFDAARGHSCPFCAKNKKLSFMEIKGLLESDNKYKILSSELDYKNVHSTLAIMHQKCGITYYNSYNNYRNGQRCPICEKKNSSGGLSKKVRNIAYYLLNRKINFTLEYSFNDLIINKKKARYDFFIKDLNLLIEYQGKQHFKYEKNGYFTEEKFKKIKESDLIKKSYAINHGFNFEEIIYTDNEIEKISQILDKYKKI